jgi:hypothetical protein
MYCLSSAVQQTLSNNNLVSDIPHVWIQIRRPGFDSRQYQKRKVVSLERGPLSLVSTTEELLGRKRSGSCLENREYGLGIRHADDVAPSVRKSWQSLRRQEAVARSV